MHLAPPIVINTWTHAYNTDSTHQTILHSTHLLWYWNVHWYCPLKKLHCTHNPVVVLHQYTLIKPTGTLNCTHISHSGTHTLQNVLTAIYQWVHWYTRKCFNSNIKLPKNVNISLGKKQMNGSTQKNMKLKLQRNGKYLISSIFIQWSI